MAVDDSKSQRKKFVFIDFDINFVPVDAAQIAELLYVILSNCLYQLKLAAGKIPTHLLDEVCLSTEFE